MSTSPALMSEVPEAESKPELPPLMQETFDRLPHRLAPLPDFAAYSAVFDVKELPQLPYLYNTSLAAIVTSELDTAECDGSEVQTWGEGKYPLSALAETGRDYMRTIVKEKVQDLAPGPQKDRTRIHDITNMIMRRETLALLACTYAFPTAPSSPLPINRVHNPSSRIDHAADLFSAYIGAMRIPFGGDPQQGADIVHRLNKYLDDLISPKVWVKLDDLVKQRHRGEKFGQQQLLDPNKKSLLERMSRPNPLLKQTPSTPLAPVSNTVQATPIGPSLLNSPSPFPASLHGRPRGLPESPQWMSETPTRPSSGTGPMPGGLSRTPDTRLYDMGRRSDPRAPRLKISN